MHIFFCSLPIRFKKRKKNVFFVERDAAWHPLPMARLWAAEPHSWGNEPPKNGQWPPALCCPPTLCCRARRGPPPGLEMGGWGGQGWEWKLEVKFLRFLGREGPWGVPRKRKGQGSSPGSDAQGPEVGWGASWKRGAVGTQARRGADAQKMNTSTQNLGGGMGGRRPVGLGTSCRARGSLTCQQEGASGPGAHPACPPTLSRPSTRVSQLPPRGKLHSWPA